MWEGTRYTDRSGLPGGASMPWTIQQCLTGILRPAISAARNVIQRVANACLPRATRTIVGLAGLDLHFPRRFVAAAAARLIPRLAGLRIRYADARENGPFRWQVGLWLRRW